MIKPLGNQVFILPDWDGELKSGVIVIPQSCIQHLPNTGTVVAISEQAKKTCEFKVGDRVLYDRFKSDISMAKDDDGNTLARVSPKDVMAVL